MKKNFFTTPKALAAAFLALAFNAHAVEYKSIDAGKSNVAFSYKQMGVAMDGRFKKFAAQVNFDPAKAEQAKASFDVDLASVDTGSGEADDEVVTKSWFNTAAFPKASFVAIQRAVNLTGLGALLAALLASWFLTRALLKPIRTLADAADKAAAGDYSQHVDVKGNDEIGSSRGRFTASSLLVVVRPSPSRPPRRSAVRRRRSAAPGRRRGRRHGRAAATAG